MAGDLLVNGVFPYAHLLYPLAHNIYTSFTYPNVPVDIFFEIILVFVFPTIFAFVESLPITLTAIAVCTIVLCAIRRLKQPTALPHTPVKRPHWITSFRVQLMVATLVYITAADYGLFAMIHHKTECFGGFSVMDLGVGLFICSNGIVYRPAPSYIKGIVATMRANVKLIALGLFRLWIVVGLGYYQPLTEYGQHSNFFLVIAAIMTLRALIPSRVPHSVLVVGSFAVLTVYEYLIQETNIANTVFNRPRTNPVADNAESFLMLIGGLPLLIIAQQIGQLRSTPQNEYPAVARRGMAAAAIFIVAAAALAPPSRQLNSPSYVLLSVSVMLFQTAANMIADATGGRPRRTLTGLIGRHQLLAFMIGNFATGFVNVICSPDKAGPARAAGTMGLYFAVIITALVAYEGRVWAWHKVTRTTN